MSETFESENLHKKFVIFKSLKRVYLVIFFCYHDFMDSLADLKGGLGEIVVPAPHSEGVLVYS